jgi:hypothetical protein
MEKSEYGIFQIIAHTDLDLPSMEAASNVMLRPQVRLPDLPNRFTLVFYHFIISTVQYSTSSALLLLNIGEVLPQSKSMKVLTELDKNLDV